MEGSSKEEFNPLDFDEGLGYKVGSLKAKFEKKKKKIQIKVNYKQVLKVKNLNLQ